jgi:hypothetical protein
MVDNYKIFTDYVLGIIGDPERSKENVDEMLRNIFNSLYVISFQEIEGAYKSRFGEDVSI